MYTVPKGHWGDRVYVILRSPRPASQLAPALRSEVAAIDAELAVDGVRTLSQVVSESTGEQRVVAGMVNAFMVMALGLVAIGLYGTLSYHVLQRTREIGVRMALGALKRDILRLVFVQGSRWVLSGVLIGIGGTLALSSVLQAIVYRMDRFEVMPILLAVVAVGGAALIACWLPARRAARMSPVKALRAD
jgi:ABC-type antimicrobial peptide transport system permease subunit